MGTIGTLPGERLAGLSADLFHKLQKGVRTLDELALFNQGKNPFDNTSVSLSRNQHGHFVVTITGLDLAGAEEVARLEASVYRVSDYAKSVLLSEGAGSYDQGHRLVAGQSYQVAFMPGKVIAKDTNRTSENLRNQGLRFGYEKPLAGIMPRIRELVSDKHLEEMGFLYITGLHDTVLDSGGGAHVLAVCRGDGRSLHASWVSPGFQWFDRGAFAFLVPAS